MYLPSYVLDTECDLLGVFISEHNSHATMHVRKTDFCESVALIIAFFWFRLQSLSSAVVQLLMALPSDPNRWTPQQSGVVCFVKDSPQRSFFIRLYDIKVLNTLVAKHGENSRP